MATIDYKEKYEQALEVAQRFYNNSVEITKKGLEEIFPELKESEDDEIRKSIIAIITNYVDNLNTFKPKMIAWLEKQSEQKPADTEKGTNGNEREIPNLEPPLTIKHAKEVMGIKQDNAWSEEDEKCIENAIMYCEWARDIAPNLHCYEISEKSINWLKSLKERYTWKPSDEQMETLENVRKILHTNDIYSKANNLMYNFEELIRTLKKLREK